MKMKIIVGIIVVILLVGVAGYLFLDRQQGSAAIAPAECFVYWVAETEPDHSQIVTFDPATKTVRPIGPVHEHAEFNGFDINLTTGILYTTTGKEGDLVKIDGISGQKHNAGVLPVINVEALAYHLQDRILWMWAEGKGLMSVDPVTLESRSLYNSLDDVKALSWSQDGTLLYAASSEGELFVYDLAEESLVGLANNWPLEIEGLSPLEDGTLLIMSKEEDDEITILSIYDPELQEIVREVEIESEYVGSVGVAWPQACGIPF